MIKGYTRDAIMNHYIAGENFEDIAKACRITLKELRQYIAQAKTASAIKPERTPYAMRHEARYRHEWEA